MKHLCTLPKMEGKMSLFTSYQRWLEYIYPAVLFEFSYTKSSFEVKTCFEVFLVDRIGSSQFDKPEID